MKKVALTHSLRSACSTALVVFVSGPSSKVRITSFGFSSTISLYCMKPMRGSVAGSIATTREVPSALGLPGQSSAAKAGQAASDATIDTAAAEASSNFIRLVLAAAP